MKLIITEDKLYKTFAKFMDKFVDSKYRAKTVYIGKRGNSIVHYEFLTKEGNTFGTMYENDGFLPSYNEYEKLDDLFGNKTDELLLQYLRDKFGDKILFRRIA